MKIHHVTDEWDYTISIDRIGDSSPLTLSISRQPEYTSLLTLSILRQPEYTPARELDGILIASSARVALERKAWSGERWCVTRIWLRGTRSRVGVPDKAHLKFLSHTTAVTDMGRIYDALRHYERGLYSGDIK